MRREENEPLSVSNLRVSILDVSGTVFESLLPASGTGKSTGTCHGTHSAMHPNILSLIVTTINRKVWKALLLLCSYNVD